MSQIDPNFPPEGVPVTKGGMRAQSQGIFDRIGTIPDNFALRPTGTVVLINDGASGLTTADVGDDPVQFANRSLRAFKPNPVIVAGPATLTTAAHGGCALFMTNTGAVTLQLERDASTTVGVQACFTCSILRGSGGGSVQVTSSNMTSQNTEGHTRVAAGQIVNIVVDPTASTYWFSGGTAP